MEYISVGKIMEAFALKGEVKIASDFKFKNQVFVCGNKLYIGSSKKEVVITKSRYNKNRFYILFDDIKHISQIEKYLKEIIYIKKSDLDLKCNYLDEDIIGFDVLCNNKVIGKLVGVRYISDSNSVFEIKSKEKFFIPNNKEFVKSIDFDKKIINVEVIEGMIK